MGLLRTRATARRAITAASNPPAGRLPAKGGTIPAGSIAQSWQFDAQAFYDSTGPLKYAAMYRGNMYRRVRLYAAVIPDDDGDPIPCEEILDPDHEAKAPDGFPADLIQQAVVELARIRSPIAGVAGLLYDFGVNLTVSGDCWLAVEPDDYEVNGERWSVFSVTELTKSGTWPDKTIRWQVIGPPNRTLPQGTLAYRIYNPHPHRHQMADSSTMGVLDDLEELALIRRAFRSQAKSRLSRSGLLLVPSELDFGTVDPDNPDSADKLTTDLLHHMSAPLENEASAANQVPHILRGPGEHFNPNVFRWMPFDNPGDQVLDAREDKKLKTFAIGMDTPPEVILGIGDINHWGSWQVSESSWKAHGEPGMILICGQVGSMPLRELLTAAAGGDGVTAGRWSKQQIGRIIVWFDAEDLVDHPDKFTDAGKAHEALVLSDAAYRKYGNFAEEDKPADEEIAQRVERYRLMHARGAEPSVIPVGDVAGPQTPQTTKGPPPSPAPAGQTPAPATQPAAQQAPARAASAMVAAAGRPVGHRLADLDLALYARVHGMCQTAVRRQLERAGAQITSKAQRNKPVLEQAKAAPKHAVAAALGRSLVADLGLVDDQLTGDFTDLLDQVDSQVDRTRKAGLAALLAFLAGHGQAPDPAQLVEYDMAAQRAQQDGRLRLQESLSAFTLEQLYQPDPQADDRGEGVEAGDVPPGLVRTALAVYGGQSLTELGQPDDGSALRAVAAGDTNFTLGGQLGLITDVWEWIHGGAVHPFPPHLDLDGQIFSDSDTGDTRRANTEDAWLGQPEYSINDHPGCSCYASYQVEYAGPDGLQDAA